MAINPCWLQAPPPAVDTVFVDPYTGALLGIRRHGAIGDELHHSPALSKTRVLLLANPATGIPYGQ